VSIVGAIVRWQYGESDGFVCINDIQSSMWLCIVGLNRSRWCGTVVVKESRVIDERSSDGSALWGNG
jgi:hypothetical protein